MKVLHVIPSIASRYGGPSSAIRGMCGALSQAGIEVELATTDADGPDASLDPMEVKFDWPVHMFRSVRSEQWKYSPGLRDWLRDNLRRFDLLHVHGVWSYAGRVASRAAIASDVPYIVRPAGMLSEYTFKRGRAKKWAYWNLVEKKTMRKAAVIHATSSGEMDDVRSCLPLAKVHVIANGVHQDAWKNPPVRNVDFVGKASTPQILFLSRLHPKKGVLDYLLPAFERMHSTAQLTIAGGKDSHAPSYAEQVRLAIEYSPCRDRIKLVGEVVPSDRWGLIDAADLFVLPSHSENFGIVVAEAMSRGCAVVVTDRVQSCEHVDRAGAGRVVRLDVAEISNAMECLLADRSELSTVGKNGAEYARKNFDWSLIAQKIINMYRLCLSDE